MNSINLKDLATPSGWELCYLPDFTCIEMGQSPPSSTYNKKGLGVPFFQGKAEFTDLYPRVDKFCSKPNKIAMVGATLLTVRAPVGPTNLANLECCIGRGLAGIHPLGSIPAKFVLFLLRSVEDEISNKGTGSTFTSINKTFLELLKFALPPINEQKRIVAKIEELFSELDHGIESLKKAKEQLKWYRQAVLKQAFEGRFIKNFQKGPFPIIDLGGVIEEPKYGTSKKCSYDAGNIGVLRIPNIVSGKIELSDLKFANFNQKELESYSLSLGDILFIRSNGSVSIVGKSALILQQHQKLIFAGYLIRIRPKKDKVLAKYLNYQLGSHNLRSQINFVAKSTSGVNNINSKEIKKLKIAICSLEIQQKVVDYIESQFSVIDQLESDIDTNLKKAETLRQSILKKAFSGQLVPQDPNDEPASVLLERIKAEKSKAKTKTKIRAGK